MYIQRQFPRVFLMSGQQVAPSAPCKGLLHCYGAVGTGDAEK